MTEYFDVMMEPNGGQSLLVNSIIEDADYFNQSILLNTNFKQLAGAAGWNPAPCTAR